MGCSHTQDSQWGLATPCGRGWEPGLLLPVFHSGTLTAAGCCQKGTFRKPQTNPAWPKTSGPQSRSPVCAFASHSPPRPPVQGHDRATQPTRAVEGTLGDQPKELLSWRDSRNCPEKLGRRSSSLSPVSVTTLLPLLKWDTETRVRFLLNHQCSPKGPQQADMNSAVHQETGQHPLTSSEPQDGGKGFPSGHPFSLPRSRATSSTNSAPSIPISEPHLPSAPTVAFGGQARAFSLSGSLRATWGVQA